MVKTQTSAVMGSLQIVRSVFVLIICFFISLYCLSRWPGARQRQGYTLTSVRNPGRPFEDSKMLFTPEKDDHLMKDVLACGDLCRYDKQASWSPSPAQCTSAWLRLLSACSAIEWPPPKQPPAELLDAYTMGGLISQKELFFQQRYSGGDAMTSVWEPDTLDAAMTANTLEEMAAHVKPSYGLVIAAYVEKTLSKYAHALEGKVGVVWGSERPWAEVLLARAGARHVTTVEYGHISSPHPRFSTVTPPKLAGMMVTHPRAWDFAFTYSSLEHSGLGRYGDALNPWGDMEAAVQTWCLLNPGGFFFLGLPCKAGCTQDELVWNAHRFYGPLRLAEMFAGYEHVETILSDGVESAGIIHVLRKPPFM